MAPALTKDQLLNRNLAHPMLAMCLSESRPCCFLPPKSANCMWAIRPSYPMVEWQTLGLRWMAVPCSRTRVNVNLAATDSIAWSQCCSAALIAQIRSPHWMAQRSLLMVATSPTAQSPNSPNRHCYLRLPTVAMTLPDWWRHQSSPTAVKSAVGFRSMACSRLNRHCLISATPNSVADSIPLKADCFARAMTSPIR